MERTNENLIRRCNIVEADIHSLPIFKITESCKDRLLKLVQSELNFLSRSPVSSAPISTNIGYVESIVNVVQQPAVSGVSCVCKTIQGSLGERSSNTDFRGTHVDIVCTYNRRPAWFIVSDRNPKYISWSDKCNRKGLKTRLDFLLKAALGSVILRPISIILYFANGIDDTIAKRLKEDFRAVEMFEFTQRSVGKRNGTEEYLETQGLCYLPDIFQDVEDGEWVNILGAKKTCTKDSMNVHEYCYDGSSHSNQGWMSFEIKVNQEDESRHSQCQNGRVDVGDKIWSEQIYYQAEKHVDQLEDNLSGRIEDTLEECILPFNKKFFSLLSSMDLSSEQLVDDKEIISFKDNLINLDTTALVALVSELSNGGSKKLAEMSVEDMNKRFKSTTSFMREQATSELEHPILESMLSVLAGKRAIISEYVHNEFKDLISMCSGPNEKQRAEWLLKCILVVPNNPSVRVMGLPETGKIKLKHKIIFGTGDHWHAPTLTANMGFVRAVLQTGMSLLVLEHRPRALVGC